MDSPLQNGGFMQATASIDQLPFARVAIVVPRVVKRTWMHGRERYYFQKGLFR